MYVLKEFRLVVAVAALVGSGVVQAGPQVTVVFKNNGSAEAVYSPVDSNEALTRTFAVKVPNDSVSAGSVDTYVIKGRLSPYASHAFVRYSSGNKVCKFKSTYVMTATRSVKVPKWIKEATASGGARCDARINSVNNATHEWIVEFVMS
ncbi:hypothetical protein ALQ04_04439 [Pseudomonas cichorii]|uniref:Uncharacterized protein n=1 Tax=Pseudomonas cichorii TaxID=36746 RepID=A0A3M4LZW9_PSECI|nr:hypothetical protein [Pseudomonas cichorii]RMQ46591.1 hypothetical protein ALQ04_04439 [Pseudomonas cichorii]